MIFVEQRQSGCMRFSYVPDGSGTPRRYRCQPDLALNERAKELRKDSRRIFLNQKGHLFLLG